METQSKQHFLQMTVHLSWAKRLLCGLCGVLSFGVLIPVLMFIFIVSFVDILLCTNVRGLHKFVRKMRQRVRWLVASAFACVLIPISPSVGALFLMSYAQVFGHNIPRVYLKYLLKKDFRIFAQRSNLEVSEKE